MASQEAKNRRRSMALERMNIAVARISAKHDLAPLEMPKRTKDKDLREIIVFERIAGLLESLLGADAPVLENHPLVMKQANRKPIADSKPKEGTAILHGPKIAPQSKIPKTKVEVAKPEGKRN